MKKINHCFFKKAFLYVVLLYPCFFSPAKAVGIALVGGKSMTFPFAATAGISKGPSALSYGVLFENPIAQYTNFEWGVLNLTRNYTITGLASSTSHLFFPLLIRGFAYPGLSFGLGGYLSIAHTAIHCPVALPFLDYGITGSTALYIPFLFKSQLVLDVRINYSPTPIGLQSIRFLDTVFLIGLLV